MFTAGRVIWFYLGKLLWPADLLFMYPRWQINPAIWWQYLFPLALLVLLGVLWGLSRRWRGPLAGLLFFAGTLFPGVGILERVLVQVFVRGRSFSYLASLGIISLVSAGAALSRFAGEFGIVWADTCCVWRCWRFWPI